MRGRQRGQALVRIRAGDVENLDEDFKKIKNKNYPIL